LQLTVARPRNQIETARITFSPSAEVVAYIDDLVRVGIFGKARADVVNTMVARELERLIREGFLQLRKAEQQ
jgi:hypothetical protein